MLLHHLLEVLLRLRCLFILYLLLTSALRLLALLISLRILHHLHLLLKHHLRLLLVLLSPSLVLLSLHLELLALLLCLRLISCYRFFLHPRLGLVRLIDHELHPLLHVLIDLVLGHLLAPSALPYRLYQLHDHFLHL